MAYHLPAFHTTIAAFSTVMSHQSIRSSSVVTFVALITMLSVTAPVEAEETLVIELPVEPNRDPDTGGHPDNDYAFEWIQPIQATCTSDDPNNFAPAIVATVEPFVGGFANNVAPFRAPAPRDARGRGAMAMGYGTIDSHLVIEHLAGLNIVVHVACGSDAQVLSGSVSTTPPPGWSGGRVPVAQVNADGEPSGCSAVGVRSLPTDTTFDCLAWLVAGLLWRRRRRLRPLLLAVVCGVLAVGCDDDEKSRSARPVYDGVGETNRLPLWPLGEGIRPDFTSQLLIQGTGFSERRAAHSMRRVKDGIMHAFDQSLGSSRGGLHLFVEDDTGDIYLAHTHGGPVDPPILLVPRTVRLGMSWTARHALDHSQLRNPVFGIVWDQNDTWQFVVSHRVAVPTEHGERVAWRIEWVGPVMPSADENVREGPATDVPPVDEVFRMRGYIDLVEGFGPVVSSLNVHALDAVLALNTYSNTTQEPTQPPFQPEVLVASVPPLPPDFDVHGVAMSQPQETALLSMTPVAEGQPLFEDGEIDRFRGIGQVDGELDIFARAHAFARSILQTQGFFDDRNIVVDEDVCARLSSTLGEVDENDCPSWYGFVHPDGERWNHSAARYLGAFVHEDVFFEGWFPYTDWLDSEGRLLSFVESGTHRGRFSIVDWGQQRAPEYLTGGGGRVAYRLNASPVPVVFDELAEEALIGARRHDNGRVTLVSLPQTRRDAGFAAVITHEGTLLSSQSFPAEGMSLFTGDQGQFMAQVGRLGELRSLVLDEEGVWPELRGRLDLPKGHWAVGALQLDDDSFIVATRSGPDWDFAPLSNKHWLFNKLGVALRQPPVAGPTRLWRVEAPPTGVVDRALALRMITTSGGSVRSYCVPPRSQLELRFFEGDAELGPDRVRVDGERCWWVAASPEAEALPTRILVDGEGWLMTPPGSHAGPVIDPGPGSPPPVSATATFDDGSTAQRDVWCAPLFTHCYINGGDLLGLDVPNDPIATNYPRGTTKLAQTVASRGGAGLWLVADDLACLSFDSHGRCEWQRPPDVGAEDVGYTHIGRGSRTLFWAPPGLRWPSLQDGGLVGGGHRLSPKGTVTEIPSEPEESLGVEPIWVFDDGSACGRVDVDGTGARLTCATPDGQTRQLAPDVSDTMSMGLAPHHLVGLRIIAGVEDVTDPETGNVVPGDPGGAWFDIVDVTTMEVTTWTLSSVGPQSSLSIQSWEATDGSLWWQLSFEPLGGGDPLALVLFAHDGVLSEFAYDALPSGVVAILDETVFTADGAIWPRPDAEGSTVCLPAERCNGVDDDCDGQIDEDDGATALCSGHATAACVAGSCVISACDEGWVNCDDDGANGCETQLGTTAHCLACDDACTSGGVCLPSGCGLAGGVGLAAGREHICVLDTEGRVSCAGQRLALGNASTSEDVDGPGRVSGFSATPIALTASARHSCALLDDGHVACWGQAVPGLGDAPDPTVIAGLTGATQVRTGVDTTCAIVGAGELWCWGAQLQHLVGAPSDTPTRVGDLTETFVDVAPMADMGCALHADGRVSCWGGMYAPEGFAAAPKGLREVEVLPAVTRMWSSGSSTPRVVFETSMGMYALGAFNAAWTSLDPASSNGTGRWWVPERFRGLDDAVELGLTATNRVCKLDAAGAIHCTGNASGFELGSAFGNSPDAFVTNMSSTGAPFVATGLTERATCALTDAGVVECVGNSGDLGGSGQIEVFTPRDLIVP